MDNRRDYQDDLHKTILLLLLRRNDGDRWRCELDKARN